jgi:hypothetical protein
VDNPCAPGTFGDHADIDPALVDPDDPDRLDDRVLVTRDQLDHLERSGYPALAADQRARLRRVHGPGIGGGGPVAPEPDPALASLRKAADLERARRRYAHAAPERRAAAAFGELEAALRRIALWAPDGTITSSADIGARIAAGQIDVAGEFRRAAHAAAELRAVVEDGLPPDPDGGDGPRGSELAAAYLEELTGDAERRPHAADCLAAAPPVGRCDHGCGP